MSSHFTRSRDRTNRRAHVACSLAVNVSAALPTCGQKPLVGSTLQRSFPRVSQMNGCGCRPDSSFQTYMRWFSRVPLTCNNGLLHPRLCIIKEHAAVGIMRSVRHPSRDTHSRIEAAEVLIWEVCRLSS